MRVTLDMNLGDVGTPERLFPWQYYSQAGGPRHHDVSPDVQRFLMITRGIPADAGSERAEINVVLNWHNELLERVPVD